MPDTNFTVQPAARHLHGPKIWQKLVRPGERGVVAGRQTSTTAAFPENEGAITSSKSTLRSEGLASNTSETASNIVRPPRTTKGKRTVALLIVTLVLAAIPALLLALIVWV